MSLYFSRLAGRCGLKQANKATTSVVSDALGSTRFTPAPLEVEQVHYVNPAATGKPVVKASAVDAGTRAVSVKPLPTTQPQATNVSVHDSQMTEVLNAKTNQAISSPITSGIEIGAKQDQAVRLQHSRYVKSTENTPPVAAEKSSALPEAKTPVDSVQQSSQPNELPQQPATATPGLEPQVLIQEIDTAQPAALTHHQSSPGQVEQGPASAGISQKSSPAATGFDSSRVTHTSSQALRGHKASGEQMPKLYPVVEREHSVNRPHNKPVRVASSINVHIGKINIDVQQHVSKPVTEVLRMVQQSTALREKGTQSELSPSRYYLRGF